ncbi:MAG: hypothetical protein JWN78_3038 [Bacteroidota bacterium]|nr:hypothetical protein [Bacteroidota bacterium]
MGGNAGIRGYIIQTIICVLDTLESDNNWLSVTLEPLDESEKVDIKWKYPNNKVKVTQVKSSENIIGLGAAQKWCKELEINSSNLEEYELVLVGTLAANLLKKKVLGKVKISEAKPLNIQTLIDQASTKIDFYFVKKGKPKISPKVREMIIQVLTIHFGTSSIVGTEITRTDFDSKLLDWITAIEKQMETNPFLSLAPPLENQSTPFNQRVAKKILELIGWNQFGENQKVEIFNEHTSETDVHQVEFVGNFESKLKEDTGDFIMISSIHDLKYPDSSKAEIVKYIEDTEVVLNDFKQNNSVPLKAYQKTEYFSLLFWLTTDPSEVSKNFIHHAKDNYRRNLLKEDVNYFLIDNSKANFLISSIATAKNYRDDVPVKFLYPITEVNQSPRRIGERGLKLPVQYINSSVIPITKEDKSKISFLLFCSDPFSTESLKKLIWLTIRLTSGFGNEYLLYFHDYDEAQHKNDAKEVIRSFNEELLDEKIQILRYIDADANALDTLPNTKVVSNKNEQYDESEQQPIDSDKHINEAFISILPYGDLLKPFLKTEAITSSDLVYFLAKKGIYVKSADKTKLINLMSTLLFSPDEIEDFKSYINVKNRNVHTNNEFYNIKQNQSLETVFKSVKPNLDNLTEGLNIKIVNHDKIKFVQDPINKEEFKITLITEVKDPTSSLAVNTNWGKSEVVVRKQDNKLVVVSENTITREDKLIANRIVKQLASEFQRVDFIEEKKIKVMFNMFKSNLERVNFLLGFSNVISSSILKEPDIQSIKFKFDEKTEIPDMYKDKADKDLVITYTGKGLKTLQELTEQNAKESIFLEEIAVFYKFDYLNVKNGFYRVTYSFSNALKNKQGCDGVFKSEPYLSTNHHQVKALESIEGLKKELSKEVERLKLEKLKQFNIIE